MQRFWYKRLLIKSGEAVALTKGDGEGQGEAQKASDHRWKKLQNLLMQLRKVCLSICMYIYLQVLNVLFGLMQLREVRLHKHACMHVYMYINTTSEDVHALDKYALIQIHAQDRC